MKPRRVHLVMSEKLLADVDRLAGPRRRNDFIVKAVERGLNLFKSGELPLDPARYPRSRPVKRTADPERGANPTGRIPESTSRSGDN